MPFIKATGASTTIRLGNPAVHALRLHHRPSGRLTHFRADWRHRCCGGAPLVSGYSRGRHEVRENLSTSYLDNRLPRDLVQGG